MKDRRFIPLNNNVLLEEKKVGDIVEEGSLIISVTNDKITIPEALVIEKDNSIKDIDKNDEVVYIPTNTYKFQYNGKSHLITNFNNIVGKYKKWGQ